MELDDTFCLTYIDILSKQCGKTISKKIIRGLVAYTLNYAEINQTPFLIKEIFNTKFDEIHQLFVKNDYLKTLIKNKTLHPENICNLQPEELDPDTYNDIIKKKQLIELKKKNNGTTDAYTCKKCKNSKCTVSERQTRAGDEPATVFITCVECGYTFTI
jgi:DNA-directed RNA polymerase subunit M/transcription elongation factor TFIIS